MAQKIRLRRDLPFNVKDVNMVPLLIATTDIDIDIFNAISLSYETWWLDNNEKKLRMEYFRGKHGLFENTKKNIKETYNYLSISGRMLELATFVSIRDFQPSANNTSGQRTGTNVWNFNFDVWHIRLRQIEMRKQNVNLSPKLYQDSQYNFFQQCAHNMWVSESGNENDKTQAFITNRTLHQLVINYTNFYENRHIITLLNRIHDFFNNNNNRNNNNNNNNNNDGYIIHNINVHVLLSDYRQWISSYLDASNASYHDFYNQLFGNQNSHFNETYPYIMYFRELQRITIRSYNNQIVNEINTRRDSISNILNTFNFDKNDIDNFINNYVSNTYLLNTLLERFITQLPQTDIDRIFFISDVISNPQNALSSISHRYNTTLTPHFRGIIAERFKDLDLDVKFDFDLFHQLFQRYITTLPNNIDQRTALFLTILFYPTELKTTATHFNYPIGQLPDRLYGLDDNSSLYNKNKVGRYSNISQIDNTDDLTEYYTYHNRINQENHNTFKKIVNECKIDILSSTLHVGSVSGRKQQLPENIQTIFNQIINETSNPLIKDLNTQFINIILSYYCLTSKSIIPIHELYHNASDHIKNIHSILTNEKNLHFIQSANQYFVNSYQQYRNNIQKSLNDKLHTLFYNQILSKSTLDTQSKNDLLTRLKSELTFTIGFDRSSFLRFEYTSNDFVTFLSYDIKLNVRSSEFFNQLIHHLDHGIDPYKKFKKARDDNVRVQFGKAQGFEKLVPVSISMPLAFLVDRSNDANVELYNNLYDKSYLNDEIPVYAKCVPCYVKDEEVVAKYIIESLSKEGQPGPLKEIMKRLYLNIYRQMKRIYKNMARSFVRMITFNLYRFDTSITDSVTEDIIEENMFKPAIILSIDDFPSDFQFDISTIQKLFRFGWGNLFIVDRVEEKIYCIFKLKLLDLNSTDGFVAIINFSELGIFTSARKNNDLSVIQNYFNRTKSFSINVLSKAFK